MKKILFPMMIAAVMLAACKPEAKPDASQDPAPVSQDP